MKKYRPDFDPINEADLREIDRKIDDEVEKIDLSGWMIRALAMGMLWALYEKLGKPVKDIRPLASVNIDKDHIYGRVSPGGELRKIENIQEVVPFNKPARMALKFAMMQAGSNLQQISDKAKAQIRSVLVHAQAERQEPAMLARRLRDTFKGIDRDWRKVAVTETAAIAVNGYVMSLGEGQQVVGQSAVDACKWCKQMIHGKVFTVTHEPPEDFSAKEWETHMWPGKNNVGRSRYLKAKDGKIRSLAQLWQPCCPLHPSCFKPDELVWTPSGLRKIGEISAGDYVIGHSGKARKVLQVHDSFYSGELLSLNSGIATPTLNHPIFVYGMGWVEAKKIKQGDRVLSAQSGFLKPDNKKTVTIFGQKFSFSKIVSLLFWRRMPSTPMNFDSTQPGLDHEIDVVFPNGEGGDGINVVVPKKSMEHCLAETHLPDTLNCFSSLRKFVQRRFSSFVGAMSRIDLSKFLRWRHSGPFYFFSFAFIPPSQTISTEMIVDARPRNAKTFGDLVYALSANMKSMCAKNIEFLNHFVLLYHHVDVESIERINYSGRVFNLTVEDDETYLVGEDGILVHNCRCRLVVFNPRFQEIGEDGFIRLKKV